MTNDEVPSGKVNLATVVSPLNDLVVVRTRCSVWLSTNRGAAGGRASSLCAGNAIRYATISTTTATNSARRPNPAFSSSDSAPG
jgi:hypothetical protein